MPFSLKMQPYLADRFYHYLLEAGFPEEQALNGTMVAFKRYVTLRGNRGAQRAVRDNVPLTFENYQRYREVVSTPEMAAIDGKSRGEDTLTPDLWTGITYECPTGYGAFREFGSPGELEQAFCLHVDRFNVEGFNSDISYEVTLGDCPCCVHQVKNPGLAPGFSFVKAPDAPPYPFVIASQYYTMAEVMAAIFGEAGETVCQQVRADFIEKYGADCWAEMEKYKDANFDIYYPKCLEGKGK